ncbi:MAG: MBL fold metallo-hydrolase [Gammaproteobacteria bacterium]|nr:MBL fold metallo-hydrolase [Gammaproteobacteria bacterium]
MTKGDNNMYSRIFNIPASPATIFRLTVCSFLLSSSIALGADADRFAGVEVKAQPLGGNVYMLVGSGGNIGVSVGEDGTLIIDDQFAPLAERIQKAIDKLGGDKPKLVLNTHFHGDHTGSNAFFGEAGTIIAHENVRIRLAKDGNVGRAALPVVTYADRIRIHFNDDELDVIHMPAGHTDGDAVVWFKNANVIHMGDHFFNGSFPYIDIPSGGSVAGVIANLDRILEMIPEDIHIIPGHGPLAKVANLSESLDMLRATHKQVNEALDAGKNVEEIIAAGLGSRWEGWGAGFINEERWIRILQADREAP